MASVLVVEDVEDYCEEIASGLARDGHEVRKVSNSREAVAVGCLFRPDVLVTDWLLNEEVNGLEVAEALRLVYPEIRTIIISGFASEDLRRDIDRSKVFAFLEKPFHMAEIRESVREAAKISPGPASGFAVGVLETDAAGSITYVNSKCRELFAAAGMRPEISSLQDLSKEPLMELLNGSEQQWLEMPAGDSGLRWAIRSRRLPPSDSRLFVVLDPMTNIYRTNFTVLQLLDIPEQSVKLRGHLLLIDDVDSVRMVTRGLLRRFGANLHTASSHDEALRLFTRDSDIRIVVIDYDMPDGNPGELIRVMRRIRPEITVIGTSALDHAADFSAFGVSTFLFKPWTVTELLNTLGMLN
jgi:CheY-like chemotaxis protein